MESLTNIPFEIDRDELMKRAHVEPGTDDARELEEIVNHVRSVAKPKAAYGEAYIETRKDDAVTIGGVTFTSRTLRKNLEKAERVFPFVATCGHEMNQIPAAKGDMLKEFWLDVLKATLLGTAMQYLNKHLNRRFLLGESSTMSPGAGDTNTWPIEQQHALFALLGDVRGSIGVVLTDSSLMVPNKTVSGIRFPTEKDFRTCQVCHRPKCPSRGAAFDQALWETIQHD